LDDFNKLRKSLRNTQILSVIIIGLVVFGFGLDYLADKKIVSSIEKSTESKSLRTQYTVQNLKGDSVETFYAWNPMDNVKIHIVDEESYPKETINAIKKAILSTETIEIDNSLVYKGEKGTYSNYWIGWKGAIEHLREKNNVTEPYEINFVEKKDADIFIFLSNLQSGDGLSGVTNSIVNDEEKTILRSFVTIYEVDTLSDEDMEILIRHEFGHVAGLAHATAPEDLMYPIIQTNAPYISECDLDALEHLYTDGKTSQVICES